MIGPWLRIADLHGDCGGALLFITRRPGRSLLRWTSPVTSPFHHIPPLHFTSPPPLLLVPHASLPHSSSPLSIRHLYPINTCGLHARPQESMSMALDELPTIPSTWTAPTSCFASTNYFFVLLGNRYFSNVYGTPTPVLDGNTPTGDCFPPNFSIDVPYLTDGGCPKGYTRACAVGGVVIDGQTASSVTCCPRFASPQAPSQFSGHHEEHTEWD